jgi:8-oxo-dGTP pyrophosphatase MutT (NUDIX family)
MGASPPRPTVFAMMTTSATASAPAGAVARAQLAARSAAALHWLAAACSCGRTAETVAADTALLALRTDLRSLRPLLHREWAVSLRTGLDRVAGLVHDLRRYDDRLRLLRECGAPEGEPVLTALAAERDELTRALRTALGTATRIRLALLASGGSPAPLRTPEPPGEAHLPAAAILPPLLRRRWRKLARETSPETPVDALRRAAELLVAVELAEEGGLWVPDVAAAAAATRAAAAEVLRADDAADLQPRLPAGPAREALGAVAASRGRCVRALGAALAALAALDHHLLAHIARTAAPARVGAGGLVVRAGVQGPEVLLVHRVRHDDWSVPKGVAQPGEPAAACAVREVLEETGLRCRLVDELHAVTYRDRNGRAKHVRYWLMVPVARVPDVIDPTEVDQVRWVSPAAAATLVSRKRDRAVLEAFHRYDRPALERLAGGPDDLPVEMRSEDPDGRDKRLVA